MKKIFDDKDFIVSENKILYRKLLEVEYYFSKKLSNKTPTEIFEYKNKLRQYYEKLNKNLDTLFKEINNE